MVEIPWHEPATAWLYARGLNRRRAALAGSSTLRDAVTFVLAQTNADGDGYIIEMDDKSAKWEGPEIAALVQRSDWPRTA
jgi:hypothetical protein